MPSTYTDRLRLTQQGDNENPNTWGDILNDQVIDLIDEAIAGFIEVDVTGSSDVDISGTTVSGGSDTARNMSIKLSGNITTDISFIVPAAEKIYIVHVTAIGGTITVKPTGGTGIDLSNGDLALVYCDGTDIYRVSAPAVDLPNGLIMMWSGSIASIPSGYTFCNGSNGTPDLRDKFVVGARIDETGIAKTNITGSLTQSGGSLSASLSGNTGAGGAYSGTTASHTLTLSQIPSHSHGLVLPINATSAAGGTTVLEGDSINNATFSGSTQSAGGGGGHTHGLSIPDHVHDMTGVSAVVSPPPYYALAYIMKVS